jgi:ornithine--oxo-acid transaminase
VMSVFSPGDHGSTFGGNPLGAAVGLAALELLLREDLSAHAATMGHHLMRGLKDIRSPMIKEVRGLGLLIGVEFHPEAASARTVCEALVAHGILSKDTHGTVVRFAPPLTISADQIDEALIHIAAAIREVERNRVPSIA